jgi:hypothetical protein
MKRQNLLAVLIFVVAVGGCALLVQFGEGEVDPMAFQPYLDFDLGDAP